MSEAVSLEAGPSAGALLRQAREAAGLDAAILAGALKVPPRQLDALEEDRLDLLPDVVYARALAASVCRNLGLDPQLVLERLPRGGDSRLGEVEPINVPFRGAGERRGLAWRELLARPPVLAALLLLVGAVVLLLLPLIPNRLATAPAPAAAVATPAAGPAAPVGHVTESVTPAAVAPAAEPATPAAASAATAAMPAAATPVAGPTAAAEAPSAAPAAAAAAEASAAPAASLLEFHAVKPTWVQVTDSRGSVYLRRMLSAGETVGVSGATPLSVVIGNAAGTQVQVRGKPYDLKSHVRGDNVARFEVR